MNGAGEKEDDDKEVMELALCVPLSVLRLSGTARGLEKKGSSLVLRTERSSSWVSTITSWSCSNAFLT